MIVNAIVLINSVDESARLTGVTEIDEEESRARTAFFTLLPATGITDIMLWVGADVVIKSVVDGNTVTEFTGIIDEPSYNIQTGLTKFSCTDNMQEIFETKTLAEIDAIVGGYWSEAAFNESAGWEYASERLSTIPSSLDLDELLNFRTTLWASKATPDFTYTEAEIINNSLQVSSVTNRRNIVNAVNITLNYRYKRLKERQKAYVWDDPYDVCGQGYDPNISHAYPTKNEVIASIEGTGWEIIGDIVLSDLPPTATYTCGVDPDINFFTNDRLCDGAIFTLGLRYDQTVSETYTIRVESQDSIAALGEIAVNKNANTESKYNTDLWKESLIADGYADFGTPLVDVNSDNYINKDIASQRQNAIDTVINLAKTTILDSHRKNTIKFDLPINQAINTTHTAQVTTTDLSAKGKVNRVVTKIDAKTGRAITNITLSLSKKIGVGVPGTESPPVVPDVLPTVEDTQTADLNLLTHLGGRDPTLFDPNWSGWILDYQTITEIGWTPYPKGFVVHTPAITLNSIDNVTGTDNSLINVTIPDDILQ